MGPWELAGAALFFAGAAIGAFAAVRARRGLVTRMRRLAASSGLGMANPCELAGARDGRRIHLTRVRNRAYEAVLAVDLRAGWPDAFFASRIAVPALLPGSAASQRSVREQLERVFAATPDAEVSRGRLLLHVTAWPDGEEELRALVSSGMRAASGLDAALERTRKDWSRELEALGLRAVSDLRIEGSYRGCELAIAPQEGLRLTAPLGPDLPARLEIRATRRRDRLWGPRAVGVAGLEALCLTSAQPERLRHLFERPAVKSALLALVARFPDAEIRDGGLRLTLPHADLRPQLDAVRDFVHEIQRATDWPGKRTA